MARALILGVGLVAAMLVGIGVPPAQAQTGGDVCLSPEARQSALNVSLISAAPPELCAATYQIIEARNESGAPLVDVQVSVSPPLGQDLMSFVAAAFEMSTDDGATWRRIDPPLGVGTPEDPLIWTAAQAPALARLGPRGADDDSVLIRWRVSFGQSFGSTFSPEARMELTGAASDACGALISPPLSLARIAVRRPSVSAILTGRNATRGGEFSETVYGAPGDVVEWRVEVENVGEALARHVRAQLEGVERPIEDLRTLDGAPADALLSFRNLVETGRQTVRLRETIGAACGRRRNMLEASWGCRAAPDGALSALRAPGDGLATATLSTRPIATDVVLEQRVTGVNGASRLGDVAEIRVAIRNNGAPLFEPTLEAVLPDGYALDEAAPIEVFAPGGDAAVARLANDRLAAPVFALIAASGAPSEINDGDSLEVSFRARRIQPSTSETDQSVATLRFRDGCGELGQSLPIRTDVAPRQAHLEATLTPVGDPLVASAGQLRRFRALIRNVGDETARDVAFQASLGAGWQVAPPPGCRIRDGDTAPAARSSTFDCTVAPTLGPGRAFEKTLDLTVGDQSGPLHVAIEVAARGAVTQDGYVGSPLAFARAENSAVGFHITQRLLRRDGALRDPAAPLDLGERLSVEIAANWFGAGDETIDTVSLSQVLPPELALIEAVQTGGDLELESVLTPEPAAGGGQTLWSLRDIRGGGRFQAELQVEVVDARGPEDAGATGASTGFAEASAVFSVNGRPYGVDPALDGATRAVPLSLAFRRPDLRISLVAATLGDGDAPAAPAAFGAGPRPEGDGAAGESAAGETAGPPLLIAESGARVIATLSIENVGDAPGYLDWMTLTPPPFMSILPFEEDGLDNDADGRVDEPGEGRTVRALDGALRWIALRDAASVVESQAAARIERRSRTLWRIALAVDPSAAPDATGVLSLDAQLGAAPFSVGAGDTRQRIQVEHGVRTPAIRGFLVVSGTSFGDDLSQRVRHGETVEQRLSLRFPTGAIENVVAEIAFPPALREVRLVAARIGGALDCVGVEEPRVVAPEADAQTGPRALWRLGDCVAAIGSPDTERIAFIDVTSVVEDANPMAPSEERRQWRNAVVSASLRAANAAAPATVGRSALEVSGPAIAASLRRDPSGSGDDAEGGVLDAGDPFAATLTIANVGDAPVRRLDLALGASEIRGIDCAAMTAPSLARPLRKTAAAGVDPDAIPEEARCGPLIVAEDANGVLAAGETIEIGFRGSLEPSAPIGVALSTAPIIRALGADGRAARVTSDDLRLELAPPFPPTLEAAGVDLVGADLPIAAIGDVFRLRSRHAFPEGQAPAELELWLRLSGAGASAEATAALQVVNATLARDRADLTAEGNPSGVNAAGIGARLNVTEHLVVAPAEDGWLRVALPLGDVAFARPGAAPGVGAYSLEATIGLDDHPSAVSGRVLEARAATLVGADAERGAALSVARIAEPFVEAAALQAWAPSEGARADYRLDWGRVERRGLRAVACNRGRAPAFGVALRVDLPEGMAPEAGAPLSYRRVAEPGALIAPSYGAVRQEENALLADPVAVSSPLDPGACVELDVVLLDERRALADAAAVATVTIERYQGRASVERPGRIYRQRSSTEIAFAPPALTIEAAEVLEVAEDAPPNAPLAIPFSVLTDPDARPARLRLALEAATNGAEWTLHRDLDGNGVFDLTDPLWRDGALLSPGQPLRLLARRAGPPPDGDDWRVSAMLQAIAVSSDGASYSGGRELRLARRAGPTGELRVRRLMAVDRDCDGRLTDETTQDGVFAESKDAALGECVHMRLAFENAGEALVDNVSIEDRVFDGARYVPGSARFQTTPRGLVAGQIEETPELSGKTLRFRFVGALAPGQNGAVDYRVRLQGP